ncbi:hypothetical protein AVDCRST_MAG94-407 [uncultured Leptolyngbya sp.]|uniref:Uncharacterized protein n=1 Tax=uncultured Leptolyngbya sp. TaxID=332963 RepID=A0A6J4KC25_9CYAN|nr:hypothetical protein AVDCRST_MAG94-407 [uncultured Leptolyngbya sp.]
MFFPKQPGIRNCNQLLLMRTSLVRQQLWQMLTSQMSAVELDTVKVLRHLFNAWSDLLCYAA